MRLLFPQEIVKMQEEITPYMRWNGKAYISDDAPEGIKEKYKKVIEYASKAYSNSVEI